MPPKVPCDCPSCPNVFSRDEADLDLKRYRDKGPDPTTKALVNAIRGLGIDGATVLDIGGGVGAIVLVVAALFFGVDPSMLLTLLNGDQPPQQTQTQTRPGDPGAAGGGPGGGSGSSRPPDAGHSDGMRQFVSVVLADTEDVWRQAFQGMGKT